MAGTNTQQLTDQLVQQIDEALRTDSFRRGGSGTDQALSGLLALVNEYAGSAPPCDARGAASRLLALVTDGPSGHCLADRSAEEDFRNGLTNLRQALSRGHEPAANPFAEDPELLQEFLVESRDHLATVEANLLRLEREPDDAEAVHAVFRSFHTIKGLAGFLGAEAIQELAHETENLLDLARAGKLRISSAVTDLVLRAADELTKSLARCENCRPDEIPRCDAALLEALAAAGRGEGPAARAPEADGDPASEPEAITAGAPPARADARGAKGGSENGALRVDSAKLDYLIDMVGELVIAESVVRHDPAVVRSGDPAMSRNLAQLARVVQEVQKTSMSMRMVAVSALFRKMNRLVRDLSRKSGKLVQLVTVGDDVELDRSIVEELADPMVHMIRNAVDHGIEMPEERRRAGKAGQGTVRLEARHEAGDIVIELADDGRGLDAARILAKARSRGLVGEKELPDEESVFRLIFEPGFSTAEKVTDLSGRGVGMDVVKKQIQKLRGRISIRSVPSRGCTFVLRLPLTLAIIDGLVVGVGAQRYILPMFTVREMFSPGPDTFVTVENRAEAALFRDRLLPVIRLSRLFETAGGTGGETGGRGDTGAACPPGPETGCGVLIVAEGRDQLYCIAVDQLIGKQEVVIKSLGKTYRDVPAIAGGAILGDGRVGLIVDVNALRYHR